VVLSAGWEVGTTGAYGNGLLVYHVYCDQWGIPEDQWAPTSLALMTSFLCCLAGLYSSATLKNYLFGVKAWHMLHGITWKINGDEIEVVL
jgi:hypothetical protein